MQLALFVRASGLFAVLFVAACVAGCGGAHEVPPTVLKETAKNRADATRKFHEAMKGMGKSGMQGGPPRGSMHPRVQ